MSSLGLPQSWNNESDSSLALSIVSRLSKSCVPAAEAGGVSWKLCLMPPNHRHPIPVKQELIQTFKKRTEPTLISLPWPCLALTSPIWPLMWRNCKSTWLCVMLAAAAAVKRVLILTFFVAPPPNPPPRSATRYRHYLRGQNLRIVFQGVAQFSNGLLGCCTIIFQDVAKLSDCLPRFCTIFKLSSKMLQKFQIVFQDVGQLSSKILHKTSMVWKSWSSSVLYQCTDKHLHEHDHNQHWTLVPPMCHKVTSGRAASMQVRSSLRTTGRNSHKSTKLKQLNRNQQTSISEEKKIQPHLKYL